MKIKTVDFILNGEKKMGGYINQWLVNWGMMGVLLG